MSALVLSPLARQIAALGIALCAVALSLAYPLRGYLQQQAAEQAAVAEQQQLEQQIADLKEQQAALQDPAYIKAEAKRRLQYVTPGDTVYVVKVPAADDDATNSPGTGSPESSTAAPGSGSDTAVGGDETPGGDETSGGDETPGGDETSGRDETPGDASPGSGAGADHEPWYASLWGTLSGANDSAVTPAG